MKTQRKDGPSPEGLRQLEILGQAVHKALERKRRLGQYSVTWKDGKIMINGEDAPKDSRSS